MGDAIVPVPGQVLSRRTYDRKPIIAEMRRYIMENPDHLAEIIRKLFELARLGSLQAMQLIMERIEGKAVQQVMLQEEDQPYAFAMEINFAGKCPHCGKEI